MTDDVAGHDDYPKGSRAVVAAADPGHCNVHGDRLRTAAAVGFGRYAWGDEAAVWCPQATGHGNDADESTRARCRFCGGPLVPAGTRPWQFRATRAYCGALHRSYYFRWLELKQRETADRAGGRPVAGDRGRR